MPCLDNITKNLIILQKIKPQILGNYNKTKTRFKVCYRTGNKAKTKQFKI